MSRCRGTSLPKRCSHGSAGSGRSGPMTRFLLAQLRFRFGRLASLGIAVLVATAAFVLLTAADTTGAARAHGSITRNFRSAYDIVVRPRSSYTPLELGD